MLVLSVALNSRLLRHMVDQKTFDRLLNRTIAFLENLAPISPTLNADQKILKASVLKSTTGSFPYSYEGRY